MSVNTLAWPWIFNIYKQQDDYGAWISLANHYNGPGERQNRIAQANEKIKRIQYNN